MTGVIYLKLRQESVPNILGQPICSQCSDDKPIMLFEQMIKKIKKNRVRTYFKKLLSF